MPFPTQNTSIAAQGVAKLTDLFRDKAVVAGIVKAVAAECQEVENMFFDLLAKVQLANHPLPGGPWDILDKIGALVGQPRKGLADADYVPRIRIRIRVNRSRGLAEDILQITALLFASFTYQEFWPPSFDVSVMGSQAYGTGASAIAALQQFLGQARSAGTLGMVRSQANSNSVMTWSDPYGGSIATPGWADPYGGTPNSSWAHMQVV